MATVYCIGETVYDIIFGHGQPLAARAGGSQAEGRGFPARPDDVRSTGMGVPFSALQRVYQKFFLSFYTMVPETQRIDIQCFFLGASSPLW